MWLVFVTLARATEWPPLDWDQVAAHTRPLGPTLASRGSSESPAQLRAAGDAAPVTLLRVRVTEQPPWDNLLAVEQARLASLAQLKDLLKSL